MKSPLGKLRRFALHRSDAKDKRDFLPSAQLDELAQAAQDMQDMRNCYDSLLSAAAATANSAYEFSESLREMGSCLLEKTALHDDEESGRALLMLGKVQFELQKLVDNYRSHIFVTITNPSESLLNELRTVEDMKRQCDEKRNVYEYMIAQQKEKGRSKGGKGEIFSVEQLQAAHEEFDEEATLCVFRLKSLKQGQSRSLLTQAARHHAAQLNFFRKALKSLEAVEPHVRMVAERQHIDYQFSGLEDNYGEDDENDYDSNNYGELSFDYRADDKGLDVTSASRNSMEVDEVGILFPQASNMEQAEVILDKIQASLQFPSREHHRVGSHSAPIFPERKIDPAEKVKQILQSSARKSNTYVLPTPSDSKGAISSRAVSSISQSSISQARPSNLTGRAHNLWHSSPLEQKKPEKDTGDGQFPEVTLLRAQSSLKESTRLPPPLVEGLSPPHPDIFNSSDTKKIKRKAVSGPLNSKTPVTKPVLSASGPIPSAELPQLSPGALPHLPIPQPLSSPKVSPGASPPLVSSPRINELHELPRPPGGLAAKPSKSPPLVGHSAPLVFRSQEHSVTNNNTSVASSAASPLPTPPLIVSRSFSIPSSNQRAMALHVSRLLESPQIIDKDGEILSPPLTPISLISLKSVPTVSEVASQSVQIRGGS